MENNSENKISFKEKRIREITLAYYSMPEIRKTILQFSQNRECIPQYYEGFGKRPDNFQYESDILEQVRKGATSFHCSEELWRDPLEISTQFSENEANELRIGWDLLLDIDSPYLEYSKIYTQLLIDILKFHGIENIGIKFSGNKGMHVIIPWKAFPKEIYGQKTKNMFPEWPRAICQYLAESIKPKLIESIYEGNLKEIAEKSGRKKEDFLVMECNQCHRTAEKKELVTWICKNCKRLGDITRIEKNKRILKCPECGIELSEKSREKIWVCKFCNINSYKSPLNFGTIRKGFIPGEDKSTQRERIKSEQDIEADVILVSPRHLFRMPYSLNEKTALASIVIDKDKIQDFQITDAKPFKFKPKNFYPDAEPEEAKELLLQALDWKEQKERKPSKPTTLDMQSPLNKREYKNIKITNLTENLYPQCIKLILKGIKQDGRKRALFILINFFKSLGLDNQELENKINQWNEKNYKPLKQGYVKSQLYWHNKQEPRLPPNCDKPNYKDLAVCNPDELCRQIKNPINYVFKRYFRNRK